MTSREYTAAVDRMLDVIRDNDLPSPMSVRWDSYPRPHLAVQVEGRYFRAWADVIQTVHVANEDHDDKRHMHMYGWLGKDHGDPRILLTTVVKLDTEEAPA